MIWEALGIALIGVLAVVALKQVKPELALFAGLATGIIILLLVADGITGILDVFGESDSISSGGGNSIFKTVVKIVGIGYVTEYGASVCEDYGSASIAKKVQLAGKVSIFIMAVPVITEVIDAVGSLMQ